MHVPMTAPQLQQQEDGCTAVFVNQVAADVRVPGRCARTPCSEFALVLRSDCRALCRRKRIEARWSIALPLRANYDCLMLLVARSPP